MSRPPLKMDCLLHGEHHAGREECWCFVIAFSVKHALTDETGLSVRDAYKLAYEQKCLEALIGPAGMRLANGHNPNCSPWCEGDHAPGEGT